MYACLGYGYWAVSVGSLQAWSADAFPSLKVVTDCRLVITIKGTTKDTLHLKLVMNNLIVPRKELTKLEIREARANMVAGTQNALHS